jgi:hypothetical protein
VSDFFDASSVIFDYSTDEKYEHPRDIHALSMPVQDRLLESFSASNRPKGPLLPAASVDCFESDVQRCMLEKPEESASIIVPSLAVTQITRIQTSPSSFTKLPKLEDTCPLDISDSYYGETANSQITLVGEDISEESEVLDLLIEPSLSGGIPKIQHTQGDSLQATTDIDDAL